ncbi:MAG: AraC family transcriptional regulator [Lactobacillaceae bacterium]|jgi:AraC-like DNA-binding protein|nr:AraC family transcriptional regulator [Lactobacillaceae bacterium]
MEKSLFNIVKQHTFESSIYFDFCGISKTLPFHTFGPAKRDNYLIHFVLDGQGTFFSANQKYFLEAGDFFLIRPNETTFYQADLSNPWTYAWISFGGDEATKLIENYSPFSDNLHTFTSTNIKEYLQFIVNALNLTDHLPQTELALNQIATGFLIALMQEDAHPHTDYTTYAVSEYAKEALDYINRNFAQNLSIAEIANEIKINRSYLSRIFHKNYGMSPKAWLIGVRINKACQLLQSTHLSVEQISEEVGFNGLSVFGRSFYKIIHETPSEYRKKRQHKCTIDYEISEIDAILTQLDPVRQTT